MTDEQNAPAESNEAAAADIPALLAAANYTAMERRRIGANMPYIRWAISHFDALQRVLDVIPKVATGATLADKWAALKETGDVLVLEMLADFPGLAELQTSGKLAAVAAEDAPEATDAELGELLTLFGRERPVRDGTILRTIFEGLPQVLAFIQALVPLFAPMLLG